MKRVVHLESLVTSIAETVDQSIKDALKKGPLPTLKGGLRSEELIRYDDQWMQKKMYGEAGVSGRYLKSISQYCLPVASTLALHPSYQGWISLLDWTLDVQNKKWAITDGTPNLIQMEPEVQEQLMAAIGRHDAERISLFPRLMVPLAIWEMKSLTVGPASVMEEILKMGQGEGKFKWINCEVEPCEHSELRLAEMKEASDDHPRGSDWNLPASHNSSAARLPSNPPRGSPNCRPI